MVQQPYQVLLVEDNPDQADLVIEYFKFKTQYQVVWVKDISSFWEVIRKNEFDVILLDYRLPDGTGIDVLKELKEKGMGVPVVMVTGQGDEQIAAQTIQTGALDYVVKKPDYVFSLPSVIQRTVHNFRLQKEVQRSLEKIQYQSIILNNIRDAVVAWDMRGKVTFWNKAATQLFGVDEKTAHSTDIREFYFDLFDPRPTFGKLNQGDLDQDRQLKKTSGISRWINCKTTKIIDQKNSNRLLGLLEVSRDITDRKEMEAEIKAAQSQIIESARFAAIGELASGIAHKIYNPLASVLGNVQLILQRIEQDVDYYDSIIDIQKAGKQAQQIIKQLLDFSQPGVEELQEISIVDSIRAALDLVGAPIEAKQITIDFDLENASCGVLYGNKRQIEDLWINLLLFSADAPFPENVEKKISIRCETKEYKQMIEIRDNGLPLKDFSLPKIFEPNFIDANMERGSGLGLSVSKGIVLRHKGKIDIVSDREGTTIRIEIPTISSISIEKE